MPLDLIKCRVVRNDRFQQQFSVLESEKLSSGHQAHLILIP